jgi:hypothetical protein
MFPSALTETLDQSWPFHVAMSPLIDPAAQNSWDPHDSESRLEPGLVSATAGDDHLVPLNTKAYALSTTMQNFGEVQEMPIGCNLRSISDAAVQRDPFQVDT